MKARFNNQDDALFPNQFVNARMLVDTEQNAVVIPTAALQMGNEGHFVWVLNSENKVSKHLVTPGIQDSQKVVIRAGISAGDRVVTDGIDRLTEGGESGSGGSPERHYSGRESHQPRIREKRSTLLMQGVTPRAAQAARRACLLCVLWPPRC